jgi:periplasmic protein TonB
VLLFHALVIWALQSGLLRRAVEVIVPVEVLAQLIEPPKPVPPPPIVPKEPPPLAPPPPAPVKPTVVKPTPPTPPTPAPPTQAAPQLLAVEQATPAPNAPAAVPTAPPAPMLPPSVPVAAAAAPGSAPASVPAKVVLPISDAAYLRNPKPPYPRMSTTMGEQGNVMVRILVGVDGLPKEVELQKTTLCPENVTVYPKRCGWVRQ